MKDENGNGIPDKYDKIVGGALGAVVAVMLAVMATGTSVPSWVPVVAAGVQALALFFALRGRGGDE